MDAGNFTEDEKRFVLAEYIKASQVDTEQLVAFIKTCNLQPDWFSMQLPGGRNMHQCMRAASNMLDTELNLPTVPNLKKRKSADLLGDPAQKRLASMPHVLYQPRPPSQPQAQTPPLPQPSPQLPHQVNIQPRPPPPPDAKQPPIAEGYGVFPSKTPSNGYNVFQSNPAGRKRGRPSKAEKEAQARANASSLATAGPVPISPKPAIQSTQGQGAPTPPLPGPAPSYSTYAATPSAPPAPSADSRDSRGGIGGQKLPPMHAYQEYPERTASSINSEKSPSIGNLVTSDPPAEQQRRGDPEQIGAPHTRDPPVPVTNSA